MLDRNKKGLILEGGAMRGLFTAGVLDVLMENNIDFDGIIGVSAGAAFGCNYKSRQMGRVLRYNVKYCRDKRYCSLWSLLKTGNLYGADFCYYEIPQKLDVFDTNTFESNPVEFYVTATDVESGKPYYHLCTDAGKTDLEMMRASASMPLVSKIVDVGGKKLLDGGVSDSIPIKYFESIGYKKNVVILTQPQGYLKKPNKMLPVVKLTLGKYKSFVEAMKNRHKNYNESLEYVKMQEERSLAFVIRPEKALPIKRVEKDPRVLEQVYELGREAALKKLSSLKEFLS